MVSTITHNKLKDIEAKLINFNLNSLYFVNIYILRPFYKYRAIIIELLGWYGVSAVIGSYFLISFLIIHPNTILYQILNASGALCLASASFNKRAYQPTASNTIWATIAIIALIQIMSGNLR